MKILHVHDFFAMGNSRYGYDMCRLLARRGHEVHMLAGVGRYGPSDGDIIDGVIFHTYPYGFGLGDISFARWAIRNNKKLFEDVYIKNGIDIIIFNQPLCFYGVTRSKISKMIPKIYNMHSLWGIEWQIANSYSGSRNTIFRKLIANINVGLRNRIEKKAFIEVDAIMMLSQFMMQQLLEHYPFISPNKLFVISGAVDIDKFRPIVATNDVRHSVGIDTDKKLILTVRRLVPRMGIDNLIRAMPAIRREIREVSLVIGGDGPLRKSLEELSSSLGCSDCVMFIGYVSDEKLPSLYSVADLFVLPTKELEGFGLVTIEAMACGTPVMATPIGGIPEVLEKFDKDMLFEGTEHDNISDGVIRFFKTNSTSNELRRRCREYVVRNYDWNNIISNVEELFMNVINSANRRKIN